MKGLRDLIRISLTSTVVYTFLLLFQPSNAHAADFRPRTNMECYSAIIKGFEYSNGGFGFPLADEIAYEVCTTYV